MEMSGLSKNELLKIAGGRLYTQNVNFYFNVWFAKWQNVAQK